MSTSGNGHNPAEAAPAGAVVSEDIHDHPVALGAPADGQASVAETFDCHSRRWFRAGTDGRGGLTVLMIPGIGHNVNFFGPLAARLLDPERDIANISQVVAVDLPAHGGSHIPPNVRFGQLSLADYVEAVFQIVADLRRRGQVERVDVLCGHSMGGIVSQLIAQSSVDRGTTIRDEWGTWGVVLLASALPEHVPWLLVDGVFEHGVAGPVLAKLAPFLSSNLRYGLFLTASPEDYLLQFYAVEGEVVSTAPTLIEAVSLNGYESFAAARELVGFDLETRERLKRPLIDKGIFRDYALGVASYSHDALFRPVEEQALGEYLFGSWDGWTYLPVTGDDAVHCMLYFAPEASCKVFEDVTNILLHTREASEVEKA